MPQIPQNCQFCLQNSLLKGEIIAESEGGFVVEALYSPGYYLVIPKQHTETVMELPDSWWKEMKVLMSAIPVQMVSFNISLNIGNDAGQSVSHLHFWIIPREHGKPSSGKGFAALISEADGTPPMVE